MTHERILMPFPEPRPPPLQVPDDEEDEDRLYTELDSEDIRSVHPELWNAYGGTNQRLHHLRLCDDAAYDTIRHQFPFFTPPRHYIRPSVEDSSSSLQLRSAPSSSSLFHCIWKIGCMIARRVFPLKKNHFLDLESACVELRDPRRKNSDPPHDP